MFAITAFYKTKMIECDRILMRTANVHLIFATMPYAENTLLCKW